MAEFSLRALEKNPFLSLVFSFCWLQAFLNLWLYHSSLQDQHLQPSLCWLLGTIPLCIQNPSASHLPITAFRPIQIIQDCLSILKSFTYSHLQRPLLQIRSHLQILESRTGYLWGANFQAMIWTIYRFPVKVIWTHNELVQFLNQTLYQQGQTHTWGKKAKHLGILEECVPPASSMLKCPFPWVLLTDSHCP